MEWTTDGSRATDLAEPMTESAVSIVRVATLTAADPARGVAVSLAEGDELDSVTARSTIGVRPQDVGRRVVVLLEGGDVARPIIMGILRDQPVEVARDVTVDGRRVSLQATDELTLTSGKASITLGADGRIVIKGMEIVSRARGTHKVKGATVLIN